MPLLGGQTLEHVVRLFQQRHVFLYHACQLTDFRTYVELGGIPSRRLMESSGLPFTRFVTDSADHDNGVWPKVFVNLSDFGASFALRHWSDDRAPTPNAYGPILLVLRPEALLDADDVAICLRSAGGREFSRESESLGSAEAIDQLFAHAMDDPNLPRRCWIKFSSELRQDFCDLYATWSSVPSTMCPEVSCTLSEERLPLAHVDHIIVERYHVDDRLLFFHVRDAAYPGGLEVEIRERRYAEGRRDILHDLSWILRDRVVGAGELSVMTDASPQTRHWAALQMQGRMEWQYERYARYLREGTLRPVCASQQRS